MDGRRRALVVLCGLPGAGKTTLARRLEAWLGRDGGVDKPVGVHYLGFDAIEAGLRSEGEAWTLEAWHAARSAAFEQAEQLLGEAAAATDGGGGGGRRVAVILDDNMYYRSMRREAYKLAAAHGAGYACLWVDAPLEAALARNADRPAGERVEETTVRRMAERLEPPDPTVHSWEGRFMVRVDAAAEAEPASVKAEVLACVEEAWRAPATIPRAEALSPEELEAARRKTRDSTLHATDLALRKMVGGLMQAAAGGPPSQRAALGLLLSQAKAEVLKEVHAGVVKAVNPLAGAEDDHARTGAVAERLLAAAVASAPDPAFRAWVEGLWAEAGLGIANDDL